MRTLPLMIGGILASLSLSGCSSTPVIRTVPVEVVRVERIPFPAELLAECRAESGPIRSNGDLLAALVESRRALESCNAQLTAIRELKPPE